MPYFLATAQNCQLHVYLDVFNRNWQLINELIALKSNTLVLNSKHSFHENHIIKHRQVTAVFSFEARQQMKSCFQLLFIVRSQSSETFHKND